LLFEGIRDQGLLQLLATLVLILRAEEGVPLVDAAVDEVVELATALLIEVRKVRLVAAVVERLVGRAVADLGQAELLLALAVLVAVERALEFVVVDRLEGLTVVEGGVLSEFKRLYEFGVDLLVE
jgi:hypothetical protein